MIFVTIPNRGWVHNTVIQAVMKIAEDSRYMKAIDFPALLPPYDNFLNQAAKMFRELKEYEWWLNIDDDNAPVGNPLDLVELGKDILMLPTHIWKRDSLPHLRWNVYRQQRQTRIPWEVCEGLQCVDAVGTGCMLIHRRVFENEAMQKHPFLSLYDQHGIRVKGPDVAFCERARANGFEIWTHFDYPCHHFKEMDLLDLQQEEVNPEAIVTMCGAT